MGHSHLCEQHIAEYERLRIAKSDARQHRNADHRDAVAREHALRAVRLASVVLRYAQTSPGPFNVFPSR